MSRIVGGRLVRRVIAAAVALLLVGLGLLWSLQRRLIYLPFGEVPPVAAVLPGAEEIAFTTEDGLRLAGWFVRSRGAEPPRAAVLVLNGNAGNRAYRAPLAAGLAGRGFAVLLMDYRGYGGNPGRPSEAGLILDARAARDWLAARPDVDPGRIVYLGESLGTGVACALAADRPPLGLVLRSPFSSLVDVAHRHYPFLPVRLLLRDRFDSAERLRAVTCPLRIVAGDRDRVVPVDSSRALLAAAASPDRALRIVPGADHNDAILGHGESVLDAVEEVVRAAASAGEAGRTEESDGQ